MKTVGEFSSCALRVLTESSLDAVKQVKEENTIALPSFQVSRSQLMGFAAVLFLRRMRFSLVNGRTSW